MSNMGKWYGRAAARRAEEIFEVSFISVGRGKVRAGLGNLIVPFLIFEPSLRYRAAMLHPVRVTYRLWLVRAYG